MTDIVITLILLFLSSIVFRILVIMNSLRIIIVIVGKMIASNASTTR